MWKARALPDCVTVRSLNELEFLGPAGAFYPVWPSRMPGVRACVTLLHLVDLVLLQLMSGPVLLLHNAPAFGVSPEGCSAVCL